MKKFFAASFQLFLIGALLGAICDGFHTHSGTTFYPEPLILKMAWWVPVLFGSAALTIGLTHVLGDRLLKRPNKNVSWPSVITGLLLFIALYYISGFLRTDWQTKLLVLGIGNSILWLLYDRTWQGSFLALGTALVGCYVEIYLSQQGLFSYTHPHIWGIPYWLPFLYVGASVTVGNLARKIL